MFGRASDDKTTKVDHCSGWAADVHGHGPTAWDMDPGAVLARNVANTSAVDREPGEITKGIRF